MKKSLLAVIVGCFVAAIVTVVYFLNRKEQSVEKRTENRGIKNTKTETPLYPDLQQHKINIASSISERHSTMAQIVQETFIEENVDLSDSEHKVDFDEIDSSLDRLLDEE